MNESLLYKKIYGCLAAGAIGDALGTPFEGMHYKDIGKRYRSMDIVAVEQEKSEMVEGQSKMLADSGLSCFPWGRWCHRILWDSSGMDGDSKFILRFLR